jgi:hypothetical protein
MLFKGVKSREIKRPQARRPLEGDQKETASGTDGSPQLTGGAS